MFRRGIVSLSGLPLRVNYSDYTVQIGTVGGYLVDHEGQRHRVGRTRVIMICPNQERSRRLFVLGSFPDRRILNSEDQHPKHFEVVWRKPLCASFWPHVLQREQQLGNCPQS